MKKPNRIAVIILIVGLVAVVCGIIQINDNYDIRYNACNSLSDYIPTYTMCLMDAQEKHNENVNRGWGFTIIGALAAVASGASLSDDKSKKH
jgi:hypothetical protein